MLRYCAILVLVCLALVANARADGGAVACVQEQLTVLGRDPGPVDGQFGRKTASAFAELRAAEADRLAAVDESDLSVANADIWCAALAKAFDEADAIYGKYKDALDSGFMFDIAPNASPELVAEIKEGLSIARAYIAKTFGAEIPADVRRRMTVKIVATGEGNQERGGGGGVATAFSAGYDVPRPFFDVAHEQWSQNTQGRGWSVQTDNMKSVVHEYTHGWQMALGAIDIHNQPLGNWMNEGLAEYVAYSALADAGLLKWPDVQRFMIRSSSGVETDYPLETFGSTQTPAWAGHVGFVALDWLITDTGTGIMAIKTLADRVAAGQSQRQAFFDTFGLTLDDFYPQFDAWAQDIRKNPDRALASRPRLNISNRADTTADADPRAAEKCVQAALNASGFAVGGVDGQIGSGTKAAFDKYKATLGAAVQSIPLQQGTYDAWCLLMTSATALAGEFAPLQLQVEAGARVALAFKLPQDARFRVVMRSGDKELVSIDQPDWNAAKGEFHADFDYGTVRQADNMCAVFSDGWLVKDRAGKTYEASCDPLIPAMATLGRAVWGYDLVVPDSPAITQPDGSDLVESDDELATKGDPNPGLELIPHGWNGIYRSAERAGGQWQAQKYSGEVDTYATCKLLQDAYIICQ